MVLVFFSNLSSIDSEGTPELGRGNRTYIAALSVTSYYEARARFRRLARDAGFELKTFEIIPSSKYGEEYTMDVAILRVEGASSGSVVHTSGIHGVEGYAGSGIQCYLLDQIRRARGEGRLETMNKTLVR